MLTMSSAAATRYASEMSTTALPASHAILAESAIRRAGDLIIACALIIVTLPLMAIVALAIKSDSFGPVFYRQERMGLNGRRFVLLKFRTMVLDAEPDGRPVWAAECDIRITRVGRFIRCTRIDELPQFFNVLRGEMSVVGPRPERPYFVDQLIKVSGIRLSQASPAGHKLIIRMVPQSKTLGKSPLTICTILITATLRLIW
jgi:lipopolysaccharide/colanic/teichoic acid biosynthesis glycosyltransferase